MLWLCFPKDRFASPLWFWKPKQNGLLTQIESCSRYNNLSLFVPESKQIETNYTKGRSRIWLLQQIGHVTYSFEVNSHEIYLGEPNNVSMSSTVKGVQEGSRFVADGRDLQSATKNGD